MNKIPEPKNLKRNPSGPKPKLVNRRCINISLTDELIDRAREIGNGLVSVGIRKALGEHKA